MPSALRPRGTAAPAHAAPAAPADVAAERARPARPRGAGAATVYDALKRDILELVLAPGSPLDESEVAARFGVSRSPVREALIRLSSERLVLSLRNRAAMVAPLDLAEIGAFLDATRLVYRATARLAALRRGPGDAERLAVLQAAHDRAAAEGALDGIARANAAFHAAVAAIGGNPHYAAWQAGLLENGQRLLRLCLRRIGGPAPMEGTHHALIAAIAAGDVAAADAAAAADADVLAGTLAGLLADPPSRDLLL